MPIRILLVAFTALLAVYTAELSFDFMPASATELFQKFAGNTIFIGAALVCGARGLRTDKERAAWLMASAGLLAWGIGNLYFTLALWDLEEVPIPSWADVGYLAFFPFIYAALVLLFRARVGASHGFWLDGAIAALAVAGIAAAVVFDAVLGSTGAPGLETATNLAYPLGDLLLAALVVAVAVMSGWRQAASWLLIAAGIAVFAVTDSLFLYTIAAGTYESGVVWDGGWEAGALLVAYAAWTPVRRRGRAAEKKPGIALPICLALSAIALLVYDHFDQTNLLALGLASACLIAVLARLSRTFHENETMLAASQEEATTDALTGLANRRALMKNLDGVIAEATSADPALLVLFDLDGFKGYNDSFGHPAGDVLLARLGGRLEAAVAPYGCAYRMGGDEFCALVNVSESDAIDVIALAGAALAERGEAFTIGCSYGSVFIPRDAHDAEAALKLADEHMYRKKQGGRASAGRQSTDVLLQALVERHPSLENHMSGVATLAVAVADRLGVPEDGRDEIRLAAELHDVGKVAIPDSILDKPGPLDESEWTFMRRHTEIGERIVAAAPALRKVATIVRSTHEFMDGGGYPDALAGEDIPLAARVIAVCDAYDAMVSDRTYRAAMTEADASAELQRCAGSQFDPAVVEAFCSELAGEPQPDAIALT